MRRALVVVPLLLGLLAPASAATGDPTTPVGPAPDPVVTGYALPSATPRMIARNAAGLTTVTLVGAALRRGGRDVALPSRSVRRLARSARGEGLRTELLVGNWSNRLGAFDGAAAHRLLQRPQLTRKVAARLAAEVETGPWNGVNVDFELLRRDDGRGLVGFLTALRTRLPDGASVTVDVSASGSLASYRSRGYRLGEIAAVVDAVQLMTYDEHGPGWSGPGPIGSLDWQRRCLDVALRRVPAGKLDVGVAGYGYLWRRDGSGRSITVAGARRLVERSGAEARWRPDVGEWSARLDGGRRLWWSDGRSFGLRRDLAVELGLRGLAVWRLGSADVLPPS